MVGTLVVGAVLAVAGCGGADVDNGAAETPASAVATTLSPRAADRDSELQAEVVQAVARTRASMRARTSISVTFTGLGAETLASGAFDVAGTGVADLVRGDADLRLSIPIFDRLGGGGTVEQRIVSGVVYTKLPTAVLRKAKLPATVRWLSLDPRTSGADRSTLAQSQVDPAAQLAFLGAPDAVVVVAPAGRESVRGVPTTHYALRVDAAQPAGGDPNRAAAIANLRRLGSALAARPVLVDVWLDIDGRARRLVVSFPLSARVDPAPAGRDAMMLVQCDYYAFGVPVHVVAPAGAEVRPYRALDLRGTTG
ncbi:MAG: hypothetical protein QOG65_2932 [Actinomycetota bacterium]|nr:hypothetical protein [Actinomycetota bacterium]